MDDWNPAVTSEAANNIRDNIHVALEHEGIVLGFLTMAGVRVLRNIGIDWDATVEKYYTKWIEHEDRDFDDLKLTDAREL